MGIFRFCLPSKTKKNLKAGINDKNNENASNIVDEVLKIDTSCRYEGINDDLYRPHDLCEKVYTFNYPTIVAGHMHNGFIRNNKSFNEYTIIHRLYTTYPFIQRLDMTNIFIAGGSVSNAILGVSYVSDIDMFIYGVDTDDATQLVIKILKSLDSDKTLTYVNYRKSEYNITIHFTDNSINKTNKFEKSCLGRTLQIIFRLYKTKSEILHGFDLGSSAVGFDGDRIYFTTLSKFAYEYGCNIVDTTRRSTTYEKRLVKYNKRGFMIIMPKFNINNIKLLRDEYYYIDNITLPFLQTYDYVHYDNLIIVKCIYALNNDYNNDDYDGKRHVTWGYKLKDLVNKILHITLASSSVPNDDTPPLYDFIENIENNENNEINWITKSPGTQLTSSFNPIIDDECKWYGKYYV